MRPQVKLPRIYISGPITGYEDFNEPAFTEAELKWQSAGWCVINPLKLGGVDLEKPWEWFMIVDLILLMLTADAIALLSRWDQSRGARIELIVAKMLGKKVYSSASMKPTNINIEISFNGGGILKL